MFVNSSARTKGIDSVWALLKRMHDLTHHHFNSKHLARYVNECACWLNEGSVKNHLMDRINIIIRRSLVKNLTYN